MLKQFKNRNLYLVLITDVLIFTASLTLAYLLRFDFSPDPHYWNLFWISLLILVPCKMFFFFISGLYRGMWRYTDIRDSWRLFRAVVMAEVLAIALLSWYARLSGYPRSVFIIDAVLTFLLAGGVRVAIRSYFLTQGKFQISSLLAPALYRTRRKDLKRILIVGAGDVGERILREIIESPQLNFEVVGFLDDDPAKQNRTLHGIRILGTITDLETVVLKHDVEEILVAMPSATGEEIRRVVELCEKIQIPHKTLPAMGALMDGQVSVNHFREVSYEDLLGRPSVHLENAAISSLITGKTVMVTGGGGSIGSELVRQIVRFEPKCLIILERSECNLYAIQMELHHTLKFRQYVPILGRVQDRKLLGRVMEIYSPQVIFHAAAYKHVPMVECNPWEGVFNNVWASQVLMDVAAEYGVERFVLISTDKAVRPTNVMGTTKRIVELTLQSQPQSTTRFMAVRFGNVIGSSGSVIPLFKEQIRNGGPVTVTHPEMTRYFMTIPEACQLILQAGTMGTGGEIFILKMGTPVKIAEMAKDLIRLSGKEPEKDIRIEYSGIRPGEKLYEELITHGEGVVSTTHDSIMVLRPESETAGVLSPGFREQLEIQLARLVETAKDYDVKKIKTLLHEIVPEYDVRDCDCVLETECHVVRGNDVLDRRRGGRKETGERRQETGESEKR
ncbi:MAG: polysaccharide biosynthesis protein [Desulforhopalus sp.]|nr:polysaccharide biosynthesis protein [Desulforhopalus sp.]